MAESEDEVPEELRVLFTTASSYVKSIVPNLSKQQVLLFYGFFKQATEGPCTKSKPSWYEFTEVQKWEAWSSVKNIDSKKAMENYINLLNSIEPEWREKPVEISNNWVKHSCMKNDDEIISDCNKTIFDWVKEKNLEKVKSMGNSCLSNINKLDNSGLGLLHWAADRGSLEIVKYIIEHLNADINLKDSNGQTSLHYAVSCEHEEVKKYLIESGADVTLTDDEGKTPLDAN